MNYITPQPKQAYALFYFLLLLLIFSGCKKADVVSNPKSVEEKFFSLPPDASAGLRDLAEKLGHQTFTRQFLSSFVTANGFPVWEKSVSGKSYSSKQPGINQRSASKDVEMFFVPFTLNNEVKAYLVALREDTSYSIKTYTKSQLSTISTEDDDAANLIRTKLAVFAYFEKLLFEKRETIFESPLLRRVKDVSLQIKLNTKSTNDHATSARWEWGEVDVCGWVWEPASGWNTGVEPGGTPDYGDYKWRCNTYYGYAWVEDEEQEDPGDGGYDSGGGGGGTSSGEIFPDASFENYDDNDFQYTNTGFDNTSYSTFDAAQQQWPTISNVIATSDFVRYYPNSDCLELSKAQIAAKGFQISAYYATGQTFVTYTASTGVNKVAAGNGVSYLISALQRAIPVIVGVDYKAGAPPANKDGTTDHFIVIVGTGSDANGNYFTFFDNGSSYPSKGASTSNKLYYNHVTGVISGQSACTYPDGSPIPPYTVTQIRKSKPL